MQILVVPLTLSHSFSLFAARSESTALSFEFTDPFFCFISLLLKLLFWSFHCSFYIVQLWDLCLVLIYILSLLKFSLCSGIVLLTSVNTFMTIILKSSLGKLLIST